VLQIERAPWVRMGISRTKFKTNIAHRGTDANIPGTNIARVRGVELGVRAIGYFSDEIDRVIEALRILRDAKPPVPRPRFVIREQKKTRMSPPSKHARGEKEIVGR
jgi:hypothetical protein